MTSRGKNSVQVLAALSSRLIKTFAYLLSFAFCPLSPVVRPLPSRHKELRAKDVAHVVVLLTIAKPTPFLIEGHRFIGRTGL